MATISKPEIITDADAVFLRLASGVDWRVRSHGRLFGGLITGEAGSGKTTVAHSLAVGAVEAGLRVRHCDPISHGGFCYPGGSRCSSHSQIREILQRTAEVEIPLRRNRMLETQGCDDDSLIILDHVEQFLDDRQVLRWIEQIARTGSKLGVAIILCGQFTVSQFPDACRAGNLLALPWKPRFNLVEFGVRVSEVSQSPAYHVDPVNGAVTGFDPRA